MSGLEHGHAVGEIGTRRNADAAHLGRERVGDVVAIEIERGDHVVLVRPQQNLLQEGVGDHVFHHDVAAGLGIFEAHPRPAVEQLGAEFLAGQAVAPVTESAFGELHDVAFVHQRDIGLVVVNGVTDGLAHQTLGAFARHRFDADTRGTWEADFGDTQLVLQELDELLRLGRLSFKLDTTVDIFSVFTEDHHVGFFRLLDRAGHTFKILDRAQADKKIKLLAHEHIKRTYATANGRCQRSFDGHHIFLQGIQGFRGKPDIRAIHRGRFFTGINLHPVNFLLAAIGFGHGRINHLDHHRRNVKTGAVTDDERNDRLIRHVDRQISVNGDFLASSGHLDVLVHEKKTPVVDQKTF
ncbi:hypothetical protein GALL_490500 [mine drainage metagenome]|uniref:Uncharacterized protein n=1 Tax=mine drainage metagenome TaxID=410659 RepID=A0A1J5PF06_9ZZZZ